MSNYRSQTPAKLTSQQFAQEFSKIVPQVKQLLPEHVTFEKFERVVRMAVNKNKAMLNCTPQSLFGACVQAAADGLLPDGREGAIIPRKGQACWQPMVAGLMKLARNSGDIASISAQVVFEGEKFQFLLGDEERIEHERDLTKTGGRIVAAYAVARLKDGSEPIREVMSWQQIEQVKRVSMARESGPWKDWPDEMARKTVIRRLSKRLPMSTDKEYSADSRLQSAIERVDSMVQLNGTRAASPTPAIEAPDEFAQAANGITHEEGKTPSLFDQLRAATTADEVSALSDAVREEIDRATVNGDDDLANSLDGALEEAHRRTYEEGAA